MKQTIKVFGIIAVVALIGFSFTSCGGSSSPAGNGNADGVFTLTGIPTMHNGMYAFLISEGEAFIGVASIGVVSIDSPHVLNLPRIANGRVEIPMWGSNNGQPSRWFGNATLSIVVGIISASPITMEELEEKLADARAFDTVSFVNGSATRTWGEGYDIMTVPASPASQICW